MIYKEFTKPLKCKKNIAILMATYNGAEFINAQIDSILEQSAQNWELFIHDDGSTDGTRKIVETYASRYPSKIHVLSGISNGNAKKNFFYLMENVNSQYIMFADQDDFWKKNKVSVTYGKMLALEKESSNKLPILIFSDLRVVDRNLATISPRMSRYQGLKMDNTSFNRLMVQNIITGCTVMINEKCKEMALKCTNYDDVIMHDWWCALIASYFGKMGYIDEDLILYRQHGVNSVGAKNIHSISYVKDKLYKDRDQKIMLSKTERQIAAFIKSYQVNDTYINTYSQLYKFGKIKRVAFLVKYNVWKSGILRNIGLLYFC